MTPFGHIGGGVVVGCLAEKLILKGQLSSAKVGIIILISILPDLDSSLAVLFKKWRPGQEKLNHHDYFSHTPLFYLLLSVIVWLIWGKEIGVLFLLITFTHLLLDTWATDDGIMWLWPITRKKYSIFSTNLHEGGLYGTKYYLRYIGKLQVSIPEAVLFVSGVLLVILWA
jgi:hypothetical protein